MANVTYTVQNKNGSYDGDMVLKQYTSVSIDTGDTVTVDQPCRGLFIYCQGNFVLNGTINMQGRGAFANPTTSGGSDSNAVGTNGLRLGLRTASGTDSLTNDGTEFNGAGTAIRTAIANQNNISSNGTILQIPRVGGTGGTTGRPGTNGGTQTNGSGGGAAGSESGTPCNAGNGGLGSCFSGGSGGGGGHSGNFGQPATDYGGPGGNGSGTGDAGGAGNPGGTGSSNHGQAGETGTGGIVWLVIGGNFSGTGNINVKGKNGGDFIQHTSGGGGGSGGGVVKIAVKGSNTFGGSILTTGGQGTDNYPPNGQNQSYGGGTGGQGSSQSITVQ